MARPEAIAIAKSFVDRLEGTYDRLVVAGSLRRRLATIGDIEIVAIPKVENVETEIVNLFGERQIAPSVDRLDHHLECLLTTGAVEKRLDAKGSPRWGPTLKYLTFDGARLDLFSPCTERFGWILLLRTGPAEFSRQLVVPKGKRTRDGRPGLMPAYIVAKDGWLTYRTSGERIQTPEEIDVFDAFGLIYRQPWERR